ncbi:hypothetical protein DI005_16160 [Prauserella sp. PE36]|uniref:hypothetical protein n=1 Tax=Prauserella sp. PE36 TaxID=1504709 RepID=UPI000DE2AE35|nr:hypothetical protein [Prauserella sp. PE36]RBM19225.1 hypothetical protein DI005_16160 [Prauserella sp. PE36]
MKDIPFVSSGYRFMVTEAPTMKMREKGGEMVPAADREGRVPFVVMLFAKPRPVAGQRPGKGEEIKVTVASEPGEEIEEGSYVELINPVLNTWQTTNDEGRITGSGLWFKAEAVKLAGQGGLSSAA